MVRRFNSVLADIVSIDLNILVARHQLCPSAGMVAG